MAPDVGHFGQHSILLYMLQYITASESQILLLYMLVFANIGGHSEDIVYGTKMMSCYVNINNITICCNVVSPNTTQ